MDHQPLVRGRDRDSKKQQRIRKSKLEVKRPIVKKKEIQAKCSKSPPRGGGVALEAVEQPWGSLGLASFLRAQP